MAASNGGLADEATLAELHRKGMELYERILPLMAEDCFGQFIAIHVDSGDYRIGPSATKASRALLEVHPPDGRQFIRKIGDEPEYELGARILAGEMAAGSRK